MKQKPDETLDQWVRQTLSQLPDTPPPGSSFDPARLWAQLHPELQAAPVRRKIGIVWWIAAACLTGLTLSWFWMNPSPADRKTVAVQKIDRKEDVATASHPTPNWAAEVVNSKTISTEKNRPMVSLKIRSRQKQGPDQEVIPVRSKAVKAEPPAIELPAVAEVLPIIEKPVERSKPNVAATALKRRFRVVHENELQAEEEARPKLYRTEHFVRIGTGERSEPAPNENRPALRLPLTHKPNQ
ncbi:hypothetical protein [Spirosoma endophyticum]|uniref:Uncharacterized protein n=1 Tax=Spirosoma endophyticum TaxID=662367 RepID=A0A1I1YG76_9BACT|nr:hypothetical protein [Spirosoma endophyticum]SFE17103.1 hypothetical protein SAMN05216167_1119 [Spirosoma endophyticum]